MVRHFLVLIIVLVQQASYAQIITLKTNNPFPRIGDECEITFEVLSDTLKVSDTLSYQEQSKLYRAKKLGKGTFIIYNTISDTGKNIVGPFTYSINKKQLKSNTIELFFDKPLPNVTKGVWIKQGNHLGEDYLIIEQRISGEWKTTRTSDNAASTTFVQDSKDFVEIDKESINESVIKIQDNYSISKSQEVEINNNSVTVSYKLTVYKIEKVKDFPKEGLTLNFSNFKFLPENQKELIFKIQ